MSSAAADPQSQDAAQQEIVLQIPKVDQTRILHLASQGLSNSQIKRITGRDRNTIRNVLISSGFATLVDQARNRAAGMLDRAGDVLDYRLRAKKDPNVALALYRGTGVLVDKQELKVQTVNAHVLITTPPADWADDYKANVIVGTPTDVTPTESSE